MFAIRNKKDKRWVYGTDYRYNPPRQKLSDEEVKIYKDEATALADARFRQINFNNYQLVSVGLIELNVDDQH